MASGLRLETLNEKAARIAARRLLRFSAVQP
jgi:hypothetical protein